MYLAIFCWCICILCVDSQVDQHFADGTFPVKNKKLSKCCWENKCKWAEPSCAQ